MTANSQAKYLLGQVLGACVAIDVGKVMCVLHASKITFIPTLKEHLVGVLAWGDGVLPVIDLAISRPKGFDYDARGSAAVAIKTAEKGAFPFAIYFEQILGLRNDTPTHFSWGDRFSLKRTFCCTSCFSYRLKNMVNDVMVPVVEGQKILDFLKHGLKGGEKWQGPIQEQ